MTSPLKTQSINSTSNKVELQTKLTIAAGTLFTAILTLFENIFNTFMSNDLAPSFVTISVFFTISMLACLKFKTPRINSFLLWISTTSFFILLFISTFISLIALIHKYTYHYPEDFTQSLKYNTYIGAPYHKNGEKIAQGRDLSTVVSANGGPAFVEHYSILWSAKERTKIIICFNVCFFLYCLFATFAIILLAQPPLSTSKIPK